MKGIIIIIIICTFQPSRPVLFGTLILYHQDRLNFILFKKSLNLFYK